jgi:hypothetical protein
VNRDVCRQLELARRSQEGKECESLLTESRSERQKIRRLELKLKEAEDDVKQKLCRSQYYEHDGGLGRQAETMNCHSSDHGRIRIGDEFGARQDTDHYHYSEGMRAAWRKFVIDCHRETMSMLHDLKDSMIYLIERHKRSAEARSKKPIRDSD